VERSAFLKAENAAAGGRARDARQPAQHDAPSAQSKLVGDPNDLVARALAILTEHNTMNEKPQSRQGTNVTSELATQSVDPTPTNAASEVGAQSSDLTLQRRVLSDGTECLLPLRYFDVQSLVATFLTELNLAAELLKGTGLQAVPQEDGKAVVVLYCIEYRKTDLGPYNEVGLTIVTQAPGDPIPANYVVNLPVTTALANRVGREIWGYNKFVAAIDVHADGKRFSTILRDTESEMICALEGDRGASVPAPPTDILTFTLLQGRVVKTAVRVLTPFHASSGDGFVFKIGPSRHPMTNNLRTLALDGARPALVQYADPLQILLFAGREVS
jgi:hypothetical protein